jgi:hypothetical protein
MKRWIRFLLMIVIGGAIGAAYGWLISPVKYVDTSPATLRIDFKTDVVLMTAEAYRSEGDLGAAVQRLSVLGVAAPTEQVRQAISFAQQQGYNENDIQRMTTLLNDLERQGTEQQPEPPAGASQP